jgi:hypothetical protein
MGDIKGNEGTSLRGLLLVWSNEAAGGTGYTPGLGPTFRTDALSSQ